MEKGEKRRKTIRELGKYGLIDLITSGAPATNKSTVIGVGDDAAAIGHERDLTLVSTDLLLEGIHFNLVYTPLKHLGYKAVIRAISDICAMNGKPGQVLVSLGIGSRMTVEMIREIYDGIYLACEKYGLDLAGGDTTSSLTGLTLGVTALGHVRQERIVRRNGARANDLICVTGDFGAAFMGLQLLERERKLFEKEKVAQPDLAGYEYVVGRQLKPEIPITLIDELEKAEILPTSMIDVTEGLSSDLLQLCKASGTGCRIYYSKVPIDYETTRLAEEFNIDAITPALNGGEDYELLFTAPLETLDKLKLIKDIKVIGHMTTIDSGFVLAGDDGSEVKLTAPGWGDEQK